jgi:hypothetical protein
VEARGAGGIREVSSSVFLLMIFSNTTVQLVRTLHQCQIDLCRVQMFEKPQQSRGFPVWAQGPVRERAREQE